ncbi:hypothetical protein GCM10010383_69300 [Streptomyces lomondensis]|uniref:Uncharacterized protein n=1 Tax=Streptomyces lomondensis TaxID=68229 RepID=A0ABQ2XR37_9ACTN|nr:hypothetical protein GCM10010383_69300 [Streptomyces lomondensis]
MVATRRAAPGSGPPQRSRSQGHTEPHQRAARGLRETVGARADEGRGAGRRDRDEAGEQGGAFGADPLHAHVPAHEADHGDHHRLPQQRGGLDAVRTPQPGAPVDQQTGRRRLQRGDRAHRGGQQPRSERPQHGYGEHGEPDLPRQGAHGEGDAGPVRTPPALDGEGADGHEQRPVHNRALGPAPVQQRHEHGDDHRRTAHEHAWNRRFRRALRGDDGQVEAHHADRCEQGETDPLTGREGPQPGGRAPPGHGEQQQAGQSVAQELAARVRVVAEEAVGGEGPSDEDTGERGEQGSARGGVHAGDARQPCGPVGGPLPRHLGGPIRPGPRRLGT